MVNEWENIRLLGKIIMKQQSMKKSDQILKEAEYLEYEADKLEGTLWDGDISPSHARRLEAQEKRNYAFLLKEKGL